MVDEQPDALLGIAQVEEHRGLDALLPQRAPETLDLAKRLRMTRPRHDLLDAALLQLLRLNWLLPRQVTYCVPLSVRISSGAGYDVSPARSTSSTSAVDWLACSP